MTGKKQTEITRKRQSEASKTVIAEGRHNFYIDGRTPERVSIRHSLEYKLWREAVFKRDNFTCQGCGERRGYLEAHHIKSFSEFPQLRFAIDNGVSLCQLCHAETDPLRARTLTKSNQEIL
jgi:5-methylcytosine-specific restriction endonuclease McrA